MQTCHSFLEEMWNLINSSKPLKTPTSCILKWYLSGPVAHTSPSSSCNIKHFYKILPCLLLEIGSGVVDPERVLEAQT
jgi:hypothetical protein